MNYDYLLFTVGFIIVALQSRILLKTRETYLSETIFYKFYSLSNIIGFIVLLINVFTQFHWLHSIIIIIVGFTILPLILGLAYAFIVPPTILRFIKGIQMPLIFVLSIITYILLIINLV